MDNYFVEDVTEKNQIKIILITKRRIVQEENKKIAHQRAKVNFLLEQDEDGYPPFSIEEVWAIRKEDNIYVIDNIPFYIYELSLYDEISVKQRQGKLYFNSLIMKSQNSTIRIYCKNEVTINRLREVLIKLGCKWEFSNLKSLSAINIPSKVLLSEIEQIINLIKKEDKSLDFEISSNRHVSNVSDEISLC